jgi:hypothetical protein
MADARMCVVPTGFPDIIGGQVKLIDRLKKLHGRIVIEFVANLRRPRPDGLKAVVAHFWTPLLGAPSPSKQI